MSLKKIKKFFKDYEFTDEPVRIDEGTVVTDQRKFVNSMLKYLEANSGNRKYLPYYNNLVRFIKKVNQNE